MLAPEPGMSVLDVGAGAGKFCITAALAMPNAQFVGIEWRPHLVRFATRLAREWSLSNVRFVHGDALALDWSLYDAFYLYNPFAEQILNRGSRSRSTSTSRSPRSSIG
jgi:tRNA G46 methylase TrmB